MGDPTGSLLVSSAVATAAFHTLIPDHWLPFVLIGRARGWSTGRVASISGLSASIHTALSVVLGLVTLRLGLAAGRLAGERIEMASGILLVAFGVVYALWSWKKGGHFHPGGHLLHAHEHAHACDGEEGHGGDTHLHYHADDALIRGTDRSGLYLAAIVGLNPCVLILPLMVAAGPHGALAVAWVTGAYALTTIVLMVALSVIGVAGARRIPVPGAARYMEPASGLLIAATGIVFLMLEH